MKWTFIIITILSFILGCTFGHIMYPSVESELQTCRTLLNDPHHCVSVVVDALEANKCLK